MSQNPCHSINAGEGMRIGKNCREGIEEAQHRTRPGIRHRLPGAIAPQTDSFGQIFPGSSLNKILEEPGRDVSRIPAGGKEKVSGKELYVTVPFAQGRKADDKVASRVSVSDRKDIDAVQDIRPGGKALDTSDKGLPEIFHHGLLPVACVLQRHFDLRGIILFPAQV
jgi:hypothetical protein